MRTELGSYLRNIVEFYFILQLPTIPSFSDALTFWSNHYQGSRHKAIEQLVAQVLAKHEIEIETLNDKGKALRLLEILIEQFATSLRTEFTDSGQDSTCCARAAVSLQRLSTDAAETLERFAVAFDDVAFCRSQCQIDRFILQQHRLQVEAYIQQAEGLSRTNETRGFLKIVENLKEVLAKGPEGFSCKRCDRIGDAVIALDAPHNLPLEHTDRAFDYLCPPIQQPHRRHPSEMQVVSRPQKLS